MMRHPSLSKAVFRGGHPSRSPADLTCMHTHFLERQTQSCVRQKPLFDTAQEHEGSKCYSHLPSGGPPQTETSYESHI